MDDAEFDALMARYLERQKARAVPFLDPSRGIPQAYAAGETAQEQAAAKMGDALREASGAYSPYAMAAFEVHSPDGHVFKVFADGSITGFPDESYVVNRISAIQRAAVMNTLHRGAPPTSDADRDEQIAQIQRAIAGGGRRPSSKDWFA